MFVLTEKANIGTTRLCCFKCLLFGFGMSCCHDTGEAFEPGTAKDPVGSPYSVIGEAAFESFIGCFAPTF